jgi:DNA-binding transcriptional ArsR family regulator
MKVFLTFIPLLAILMFSCNKKRDTSDINPSEDLALDSLVASKKHLVVWEQISVKAYARGQNLKAKSELFEVELQATSSLFKALSHPARLMIIKFLTDCKSCYTGDITSELPLSRTTINQHLEELKKSGLIIGHISRNKTSYCINQERIAEMKSMIRLFLDDLEIPAPFNC